MKLNPLHTLRSLSSHLLPTRIACGALCIAHSAWLIRALMLDATLARIGPLLMASAFLGFLALRPRAVNISIERRAMVTWTLVVALMHVNVVRRSMDMSDAGDTWAVPVVVSSLAIAAYFRPAFWRIIRSATRQLTGEPGSNLVPALDFAHGDQPSLVAQCVIYSLAPPRAPPSQFM